MLVYRKHAHKGILGSGYNSSNDRLLSVGFSVERYCSRHSVTVECRSAVAFIKINWSVITIGKERVFFAVARHNALLQILTRLQAVTSRSA